MASPNIVNKSTLKNSVAKMIARQPQVVIYIDNDKKIYLLRRDSKHPKIRKIKLHSYLAAY